jgi:hypothetical protein
MDPYLEDPPRWAGVHSGLIAQCCAMLNERLPPGYAAEIGERVWVVRPERSVYPDVAVVMPKRPVGGSASMGVADASTADAPWVVTVDAQEMREPFLQIVAIGRSDLVVTAIEVLSPSNKRAGAEGRELYLQKQGELLHSRSHLLEIDLLRSGTHTLAVPAAALGERGPQDYAVCLHRAGSGGRFEVWPIQLRQRLPRVLVPLAEGDADVVLDVQEVFDRMYDQGPYRRRVDYRGDPPLALAPAEAAWSDALLRQKGLRGGPA